MASFRDIQAYPNRSRPQYGPESKQARSGERSCNAGRSGSRNSATADESGFTTCHQGCASRAQGTRGYHRQTRTSRTANSSSIGRDQPYPANRTSRCEIRYAAGRVSPRGCQREVEGTSSGENRLETHSSTEHAYPEATGTAETAEATDTCYSTATETPDIPTTDTADAAEFRITKTSRPAKGCAIACTIIISQAGQSDETSTTASRKATAICETTATAQTITAPKTDTTAKTATTAKASESTETADTAETSSTRYATSETEQSEKAETSQTTAVGNSFPER